MKYFTGTIFKIALPLVFAVSIFSGAVVQAATPPAAGTAVQLQTYGTLPVMVLNLTQSPVNMNISTDQQPTYSGGNFPIAIGLSGWYYVSKATTSVPNDGNGSTVNFSNPTTPTVSDPGINSGNASLAPVMGVTGGGSVTSANPNYNFMNVFNLFPSWTPSVNYGSTSYQKNVYSSGGNLGATPGPAAIPSAFLGNATAYAQSMAGKSNCYINLAVGAPQGTETYQIDINSLGKGTAANTPPAVSLPAVNWVGVVMSVVGDIDTLIAPDPANIACMIYGIYGSIKGIVQDCENSNPNYATAPYPATYSGIAVTAAMNSGISGATFTAVDGANNFLMYKTQVAASAPPLPLEQQNGVLVMTWRTSPNNTFSVERNSADTLIVVIMNEAVYSSNQVQQYLNNTSPVQSTMTMVKYKPTKLQAQDSMKIMTILTAISKKSPQDAQYIVDMFGTKGQYQKIKNNPSAAADVKARLLAILAKHQQEIPAIQQYITKLEQKH